MDKHEFLKMQSDMDKSIEKYIKLIHTKNTAWNSIPSHYYNEYNVKSGLRNADGTGVLAGFTSIGEVHGYVMDEGNKAPVPGKLRYRGIDIEDIISACKAERRFGFEETAFLLIFGFLPDKELLDGFTKLLAQKRRLPDEFTEDMIFKAPSKNIMNKLGRSVLALYSYDDNPDDISIANLLRQSLDLIARFPVLIADAYSCKRHYFDGESLVLHNPNIELSAAENFLRMIRPDASYTEEEAHLLDMMMMIHAEHGGGNNSTFVCRALSSSGTDTYSAIAGAVGSLKGPLHGGANAKVMQMFRDVKAHVDAKDDGSIRDYLVKLLAREVGDRSGKIYGLGHAVYTLSDPRAVLIKAYAGHLAEVKGFADDFELLEKVETIGAQLLQEKRRSDDPICANVDMYSGLVYHMLGIPQEVFTPLFATARIAGWCANRIEEVLTGNRIMRPAYRAVTIHNHYVPMLDREAHMELPQ